MATKQSLYHLVIFGPQGSGKGTQAKILAERFGLVYLGTGELFREMAEEGSPIAERLRKILASGELVSDDLTGQIVAQKLGDIPPSVGFILDGYPRNIAQANFFRKTLEGLERTVPKPIFIYLGVPQEEVLERLRKRRKLEHRIEDKTDEAIVQRLKLYEEKTAPLLDEVADWAEIIHINGNQPIAAVTKDIINKVANG